MVTVRWKPLENAQVTVKTELCLSNQATETPRLNPHILYMVKNRFFCVLNAAWCLKLHLMLLLLYIAGELLCVCISMWKSQDRKPKSNNIWLSRKLPHVSNVDLTHTLMSNRQDKEHIFSEAKCCLLVDQSLEHIEIAMSSKITRIFGVLILYNLISYIW